MSGSSGAGPVIGLTTYRQRAKFAVWDVEAGVLPAVYLDAVTRSGGIAVMVPPQPVDAAIAARVLDGLDGLILVGGRDVDPVRYGEQPHPETESPDTLRDDWEFALLAEVLRRGMPVLGICRGLHVLNVALGGTLHQHLPDALGHHGHRQELGKFSTSREHTAGGTRLGALLAPDAAVKCHHHQAVDRLGEGLVVSATSGDGLVEGVEMPGADFVVAVQWHPEESSEDLRIFTGLVEAARSFATKKASM